MISIVVFTHIGYDSDTGLKMAEGVASRKMHGVQRVLSKLESSVRSGNYYEAHQMYRTLYFRYLRQKKYTELLDLLLDGAVMLLIHNQHTSGADLSNLYVDVLVQSEAEPSDEHFKNLSKLFGLISRDVPERESFLTSCIQWSAKGDYKSGHPSLHQQIAQVFWKEKNYMMARRHFLHSQDGSSFATMLVELHRSSGYTNEVDLFIAQVVLQCLCLQNKNTAIITFQAYTTQHPCIDKGPPYLLPLLNFISFLFQAIDSGRLAVFTVLCEQYQLSIKRDPTYTEYLDKIGQIFFGVPPPRNNARTGFFGNLLQSLMNGSEDLDTSDDDETAGGSGGGGGRKGAGAKQQPTPTMMHPMETETLD